MIKRVYSFFTAVVLLFSIMGIMPAASVTAKSTGIDKTIALKEGTYEEGQVLVTIASPHKTPLTKEGTVSFDDDLTVEDSWNFGEADVLAGNKAEEDFLEDKTLYVTKVSSDTYSTAELLSELDNQAYVVSVEPDYYQEKQAFTNDPLAGFQWYLDGENVASEGIHYSDLKQNTTSNEPIVAIVDTGIDYKHEDLASHMWKNPYSSLDGTYGYDFGDDDSDPMDQDEEGHGTHCAGIISAATNNQAGISGISANAKLMALKVFRSGGQAYNSAVISAFNYIYKAQKLGANIVAVNCSWGGGASNSTMKSLIQKIGEKGAVFIFAAGNSGVDHDASAAKECPYDINSPYIVKVGASDPKDNKASYSDYGASSVDLFAPGSQILSTVNNPVFFPAILPEAQRNSICSYYSSCDDLDKSEFLHSGTLSVQGIEQSQEDAFGNPQSGSYCLKLPSYRNSGTLSIYMDVTDLGLSPNNNYHVACDVGLDKDNSMDWEHETFQRASEAFVNKNGRTYLRILSLNGSFQTNSGLYIDNISISRANLPLTSFGKYNSYSGTSMAAPSASAAVAILASTYKNDSAIQRRERLLTCVRKTNSLSAYCKTGGVLDLSKVSSATYTTKTTSATKKVKVTKVSLNKKKATLRYGKKLKLKATVKPTKATNKKVKWYVSNKKYASVTQKGVVKAKKKGIGHTVKVYAKAKDGSGKKAYCKVKIKKKKQN